MAKKDLHPKWHDEAKVVCNGEEVLTTSGTQGSYTGLCWSAGVHECVSWYLVGDSGKEHRHMRSRRRPASIDRGCRAGVGAVGDRRRRLTSVRALRAAVDIWSGNHPFFQGATSTVVTDEGRVNK